MMRYDVKYGKGNPYRKPSKSNPCETRREE